MSAAPTRRRGINGAAPGLTPEERAHKVLNTFTHTTTGNALRRLIAQAVEAAVEDERDRAAAVTEAARAVANQWRFRQETGADTSGVGVGLAALLGRLCDALAALERAGGAGGQGGGDVVVEGRDDRG